MSALEELWNKGVLKPESYPELIRMLQRERNASDRLVQEATLAVMTVREQIRVLVEQMKDDRRNIESSKH